MATDCVKAATYSARTTDPGLRELNTSFCSRLIIRAELCSRAVSENYCVIGQFEVGVVNSLSAGRVLLWAAPLRTSQ